MQTAVMAQPRGPAHGAMPIHRKPLANPAISLRLPQSESFHDPQLGHSRSRTTSSGTFPAAAASAASASPSAPAATPTASHNPASTAAMTSQYPTQYQTSLRRTPTSSTSSTTGTPNRSNSGALRRSSSTRSGSSPTSYVALMRKQKATVWCDRSQYEDPRILAQQRQAKMRANMEVAGGHHHALPRHSSGGSSTGGVRSKFGLHHVPKTSVFAPKTRAGVPLRMSATEVDEGDDEDAVSIGMGGGAYHHRTSSGRSSIGSGRRMSYANPSGRLSSNSSPHQNSSPEDLGDLKEEPTPSAEYGQQPDYMLEHTKTNLSIGSGSSGERHFGDVGQMPLGLPKPSQEKKTSEDLVRRGSVDERKLTSGTRLFVANPDLSD